MSRAPPYDPLHCQCQTCPPVKSQSVGTIVSIQVGKPRNYGCEGALDPHERPWTTGFFKQPVSGPVYVRRVNLEGDGQADLENHGGIDKAVLAYSADHYAAWEESLDVDHLPYGAFGENLSIAGRSEEHVCVGDVWQVGTARLQVSQPRQPCWKLGRRWRRTDLPKRVVATGRSGWYLRVLAEGMIEAGLAMELVDRPHPDWSVARCNSLYYGKESNRDQLAEFAVLDALSEAWKSDLLRKITRNPA